VINRQTDRQTQGHSIYRASTALDGTKLLSGLILQLAYLRKFISTWHRQQYDILLQKVLKLYMGHFEIIPHTFSFLPLLVFIQSNGSPGRCSHAFFWRFKQNIFGVNSLVQLVNSSVHLFACYPPLHIPTNKYLCCNTPPVCFLSLFLTAATIISLGQLLNCESKTIILDSGQKQEK